MLGAGLTSQHVSRAARADWRAMWIALDFIRRIALKYSTLIDLQLQQTQSHNFHFEVSLPSMLILKES